MNDGIVKKEREEEVQIKSQYANGQSTGWRLVGDHSRITEGVRSERQK